MSIYNQRMTKIREDRKKNLCKDRCTEYCYESCKYHADPCFDWLEDPEYD